MTSAPDLLAERGLAIFEEYGGALAPRVVHREAH
jgi:hypothetical protein